MRDMSARNSKAPRHFWVIAVLALLWYISGAATIQMAQSGALPGITPDEAAYYASKPAWLVVTTAIATYGSALAAVFLLLRRKASVTLFAVALAFILFNNAVELLNGISRVYANDGAAIATAIIAVIAVFMVWYSRAMQQRGVLR